MIKLFTTLFKITQYNYKIIRFFSRIVGWGNSLNVAFFLGILKENQLELIDKRFYEKETFYCQDDYNKKPLFLWEKYAIQNYFKDCQSIFVVAAGGGREIYNLTKMGYYVEGSEYNPLLREYARAFFVRESMDVVLSEAERNKFPAVDKTYDGIILGWGMYTHLKGKQNRVDFLNQVAKAMNPGGVLLLSFWSWNFRYSNLEKIAKIGNHVASIVGTDQVENGDYLNPEFVHYFSEDQIKEELGMAKFNFIFYNDEVYGHAVACRL